MADAVGWGSVWKVGGPAYSVRFLQTGVSYRARFSVGSKLQRRRRRDWRVDWVGNGECIPNPTQPTRESRERRISLPKAPAEIEFCEVRIPKKSSNGIWYLTEFFCHNSIVTAALMIMSETGQIRAHDMHVFPIIGLRNYCTYIILVKRDNGFTFNAVFCLYTPNCLHLLRFDCRITGSSE